MERQRSSASGFTRPWQVLAFVIDNCTGRGSSQTGRDEGVTGDETERREKRKSGEDGESKGVGGWEEMIADIC